MDDKVFTMTKGLADSVWDYTDSNGGRRTKQKKCSTLFRTKNTSFDKNHADDFEVLRVKRLGGDVFIRQQQKRY